MNYYLSSSKSSDLSNVQIKLICKLKDQEWKFGIKSQINWFKKNIKKDDIHNLFYIQSKLIGYTLLRVRTCKINQIRNIKKYLLFDTLILEKKFRKKKNSYLMMNFNNTIIEQKKYFSFLICKNELLNFYKKFGWKKIKNKNVIIENYSSSDNFLIYNEVKSLNKKYYLYVNK